MHLQGNENIIKNIHHHPIIFMYRTLNILIASVPFFFVATFFSSLLKAEQMFLLYSGIGLVFSLILIYDLALFYLDRLVITNHRIVHVDWKSAIKRREHEAELVDIQDIGTEEAGIFSLIPIFDFGTFRLETASTKTTITFKDAPDPEGIKHFIYHLNVKPNRIEGAAIKSSHDTARKIHDQEITLGRHQ